MGYGPFTPVPVQTPQVWIRHFDSNYYILLHAFERKNGRRPRPQTDLTNADSCFTAEDLGACHT